MRLLVFLLVGFQGFAKSFEVILDEMKVSQQPPQLLVVNQVISGDARYIYRELTLTSPETGDIEVSMRVPVGTVGQLPVVFLSTGFHVGKKSTDLVGDIGDNIVVSYEYASAEIIESGENAEQSWKEFLRNGDINRLNWTKQQLEWMVRDLPGFVDRAKLVPVQISAVLHWLDSLPNVDPSKKSIVAVSLGTQVIPLAQRIYEYQGGAIGATVLGFGGADIALIAEPVLRKQMGSAETSFVQALMRQSVKGYDSIFHLSHMKSNHYLIAHTTDDEIFSPKSQEKINSLTPSPKEVLYFDGEHINSDAKGLIHEFVDAVISWGRDRGLIN